MAIGYDHDHDNEINFFAMTNFRNRRRKFGIKTDDRRRHMYVLGKTGMGKTTMLENMIINDIVAGHGVGVVDPHGDTADKLLDYIPSNRINDVIYFNPADSEYPIAFNVLEAVNPLHKHLVAQGLMGVFKKIWPDVWSARMEHILNNCILALLDYPGSTLLGINRLLVDKMFRRRVIAKIRDPIVKAFWVDEYQVWEARFRTEAIQPIQNKVGQFLSASIIRNIVAQVKSTIDMRAIMDSGKILIMNLSKGKLGEDTSRLLGGMLITKMQLAAMERVDIVEEERRDFYLYVDEFQNFATESFANILSEARKYRLNLIIAHQYIGQLVTDVSTRVRDAVFGNVGTMLMFRIGAEDAEFVAKEFSPHFIEEDMVNLAKYDIYLKLMIDGVTSNPFSALTLPPISKFQGQREKVVRVSRERYAAPAASVEDKIMRWAGMESVEGEEEIVEESEEQGFHWGRSGGQSHGKSRGSGGGEAAAKVAPKIEETAPIVKITPEVKSISLSEAMQKKPVLIKLGPQKSPPPQPKPAQNSTPQNFQSGKSQPQGQPRENRQPQTQEPRQSQQNQPRDHGQQPRPQGSGQQQGPGRQQQQRQGQSRDQRPRPTQQPQGQSRRGEESGPRPQASGQQKPREQRPPQQSQQRPQPPQEQIPPQPAQVPAQEPQSLKPGEVARIDQ